MEINVNMCVLYERVNYQSTSHHNFESDKDVHWWIPKSLKRHKTFVSNQHQNKTLWLPRDLDICFPCCVDSRKTCLHYHYGVSRQISRYVIFSKYLATQENPRIIVQKVIDFCAIDLWWLQHPHCKIYRRIIAIKTSKKNCGIVQNICLILSLKRTIIQKVRNSFH